MKDTSRTSVLNRLRTARGHLDAVVRMVEDDIVLPRRDEAAVGGPGFA